MISPERAEEIVREAKEITTCGPWSDKITLVMTPAEDAMVRMHWSALPGDSSYMDAFNNFRYGRVGEAG